MLAAMTSDHSKNDQTLRVAVLITLLGQRQAGGHVLCWLRWAEAAARLPAGLLDLSIHLLGDHAGQEDLAAHVRLVRHRPVLDTRLLRRFLHMPDHTDLAPYHPGLAWALARSRPHVIHTTDGFFSFARTAQSLARRRHIPLVNSVHTDTPAYTRLFTRTALPGALGAWVGERAAQGQERSLARHQAACALAMVSREQDAQAARAVLPPEKIAWLRLGVDRSLFNPAQRDRAGIEARYAVPPGRMVILLVGRVDEGKNVGLILDALEPLMRQGLPIHLIAAGEGPMRASIMARLPGHATCPGYVAPVDLARLYASADIFVLPSAIETWSCVATEALASGLPVLAAQGSGVARFLGGEATDVAGINLPSHDPEAWRAALAKMAADPVQRIAMGQAAYRSASTALDDWDATLQQDLLPAWRRSAGR